MSVLDQLPGKVHLNNRESLNCEYANKQLCDYSRLPLEKIQLMGMSYLKTYCHPHTFDVIVPSIKDFYSNERENRVFGFYKYVIDIKTKEWLLWYCVKKPLKNTDYFLTISTPIENFGKMESKMRRIVGEQKFLRDHYQQFQNLTPREIEILTDVAHGLNNRNISDKLYISRSTVETHRKNINRKLEINNFIDVVKYAHAFDLIEY
jgi:DNA-binding CsgD family transcriptional regulator